MKNVYMYYLVKNQLGESIPPKLYAMTDKKELKTAFESTRKMSLFYCKKVNKDKMDVSMNEVISHYENNVKLEKIRLRCKGRFAMNTVELVGTWGEEQDAVLYFEKYTEKLLSKPLAPSRIFTKEMKKILKGTLYDDFYKYSRSIGFDECIEDSMKITKYDINEFAVFMKLYGWTMKMI